MFLESGNRELNVTNERSAIVVQNPEYLLWWNFTIVCKFFDKVRIVLLSRVFRFNAKKTTIDQDDNSVAP